MFSPTVKRKKNLSNRSDKLTRLVSMINKIKHRKSTLSTRINVSYPTQISQYTHTEENCVNQ